MSKFQNLASYQESLKAGYKLLPFNFIKLDENRYVLTNMVGEYHLLNTEELYEFTNHKLSFEVELYNDLKSKHFLSDGDSDVAVDLLALKMRTKVQRLADFTGLHLFVVSLRCEHSCPYCQVSRANDSQTKFDMSVETAEKSLALVFRSPSPVIKIEFQGGEPLLNFELVKHIVTRATEINLTAKKQLQFVIATNMAVITDEIIEYCKAHSIYLSTSLDGPRELHNKNRPRPGNDSYERVISGLKKSRDILGRDKVSALMTTTKSSLPQVKKIIDEYVEQGFNGIFLRPLSPYGFAIKTQWFRSYGYQEWLDFYFEGLDYIIEMNKAGFYFSEQYASLVLSKMLTPYSNGYVDLMSPAGIGIGAVVYNYDGDVYASDEGRMLAEMKDKTFCIGNVNQNTYEEIFTSDKLLDPLEQSFTKSVPMCSDCAFEPYCGSEPVYHHATQKDYIGHKPTSEFCKRNMAIYRRLITLMEQDPEIKKIFLSWVAR